MTREEAIEVYNGLINTKIKEAFEFFAPELRESEDERIRKELANFLRSPFIKENLTDEKVAPWIAYLERQKEPIDPFDTKLFQDGVKEGRRLEREDIKKEQKPIIQDMELNDAVYDYVREHFIAGADFTPEYIKKLMENAFFAGVDYYLLKQESESCEPDTNVEKVIEDVIRVYGKTQGKWVGGYDVDTLIVNLRRAFNKKEQKPAEWSEEDETMLRTIISDGSRGVELDSKQISWLKSLRPHWKPSEEQMGALEKVRTIFHHYHLWDEINPILYDYEELMRDLKKL